MSERKKLLLILVVALVLRGVVVAAAWRSPRALVGDSHSYIAPAESLAAHMTFRSERLPEIFRTPGYPVFLLLCWVNGPVGFGLVQIAQVLLSVATVYLTYRLASEIVSAKAALWAAGLQTLSVVSIAMCPAVVTECLYSFLFLAAFYLVVRRQLAGAAVLAAAGMYVRPVGIIFVPIVVLVLLVGPRPLRNIGVFVGVFALLVAPWYARNKVETGYRGFSTVGDFDWLFYEAAGVWAKTHGISIDEAQAELNVRYRHELAARKIQSTVSPAKQGVFDNAGERNPQALALEKEIGNEIVAAHPVLAARVHLVDSLGSLLPGSNVLLEMLGVTTRGTGTLSVLQQQGLVAAWNRYFQSNPSAVFLVLPELVVMAVQFAGLLLFFARTSWRELTPTAALMILSCGAYIAVGGAAATARMRLPIEPLLNIGAGAALIRLPRPTQV